jgi:hypothetical protein
VTNSTGCDLVTRAASNGAAARSCPSRSLVMRRPVALRGHQGLVQELGFEALTGKHVVAMADGLEAILARAQAATGKHG